MLVSVKVSVPVSVRLLCQPCAVLLKGESAEALWDKLPAGLEPIGDLDHADGCYFVKGAVVDPDSLSGIEWEALRLKLEDAGVEHLVLLVEEGEEDRDWLSFEHDLSPSGDAALLIVEVWDAERARSLAVAQALMANDPDELLRQASRACLSTGEDEGVLFSQDGVLIYWELAPNGDKESPSDEASCQDDETAAT